MIGFISKYPDFNFLKKLGEFKEVKKNIDQDLEGIFIDWCSNSVCKDAWIKQASLLQTYIKTGIPIVIFDRYFSLTEKEVKWIKKFNVYLFEPALNSGRIGFNYLPEWISEFKSFDYNEKNERLYDLMLPVFVEESKYWKAYAKKFPKRKVVYCIPNESDILLYNGDFDESNFVVAIDTKKAYDIGYLNPMYINAMNSGCLPMLPSKHKYFHGLFKGLVVDDLKRLDYNISLFKDVKNVIIDEIFDRIKTKWSEFTIDHAANTIKALLL